jgi:hypothetical protein
MVQDNIAQTTQRTLIKRETPEIESMLSVESASRGVCISLEAQRQEVRRSQK